MVISLTTIPDRIHNIQPVINSLKNQSVKINKILIWIPFLYQNKFTYDIPEFLCNDPVVEIKRCHDLGPATKYLYAIKELPVDQEFVVVDDDVIYSKFLVKDLVSNKTIDAPKTIRGLKFIKKHIPRIRQDTQNNIKEITYCRKRIIRTNKKKITPVDVVCGVDGFSLKPKFFKSFLDTNFPIFKSNYIPNLQDIFYKQINNKTSRFKNRFPWLHYDDIWISAYLEANNIKKYSIPVTKLNEPCIHQNVQKLNGIRYENGNLYYNLVNSFNE